MILILMDCWILLHGGLMARLTVSSHLYIKIMELLRLETNGKYKKPPTHSLSPMLMTDRE